MQEKIIFFDPVKIDFIKAFTGTEEEQKEIEKKEKEAEKKIYNIIINSDFLALQIETKHQILILSKSIRNYIDFQLSYYDKKSGDAIMHENYNIAKPDRETTAKAGQAIDHIKRLCDLIAHKTIYNKQEAEKITILTA